MPKIRLTWDYRCPFARIAHEHVLDALEAGAPWDIEFVPFSLGQAHVEAGQPDVWDDPDADSGLLALQAAVVVRDRFPERFFAVHRALFEARHAEGRHIREPEVITDVLTAAGVDAAAVQAEIDAGWPLETVRKEHEGIVNDAQVWGVPTFVVGNRGVFVRLMDRSGGDAAVATQTIQRIIDLISDFPALNEYKFTSLER